MAPTVARLSARGAVFRKPPPTYYDIQVRHWGGCVSGRSCFKLYFQGKREQIQAIKEDPEVFKELGILIDPEVANNMQASTLISSLEVWGPSGPDF